VNGPSRVDCGIFVFVDSSGNPNDGEEVLSLRISLDRPEGAVLIVSEETMVDVDSAGDLGMVVIEIACGCWSISGLGCTYGLILPAL